MINELSQYIDSQDDTITIKTSETDIDFMLTFNTGSASIFNYQLDSYLSLHDNFEQAIEEYELNINGVTI